MTCPRQLHPILIGFSVAIGRRAAALPGRRATAPLWRCLLCVLGALVLGDPSSVFAQASRIGQEFQVHTTTAGGQRTPAVAMDASGQVLVVWESDAQDGSGTGVYGRLYDPLGAPLDTEFRVNTFTSGNQTSPTVASTGGGFVVVWQSAGQDGAGSGVVGQRYDLAGMPAGAEFVVNTVTSGDQDLPWVASAGAGSFVVLWRLNAFPMAIKGQLFNGAGARVGGEVQVNQTGWSDTGAPGAAMDTLGRFLAAYTGFGGTGVRVLARRYSGGGVAQGNEFFPSSYLGYDVAVTRTAADGAGDFVVVWNTNYGSPGDIRGWRISSAGGNLGTFTVNTTTAGRQARAVVTRDAPGNFVVVWQSDGQDGSGYGIYAQVFDPSAAKVGSEFRVNAYTAGTQDRPAIGGNAALNTVVVWQSALQDGSGEGVFAQRYCGPPGAAAPAAQAVCEGGRAAFHTTGAGMPPLGYRWRRDGVDLTDGGAVSGSSSTDLVIDPVGSGHAGAYDCRVTDPCAPPQSALSAASPLTVAGAPDAVTGFTLAKTGGGTTIHMTWASTPDADDYVVLEDASPAGPFAAMTGSAASGVTGLSIALPAGNRFYLAAGRNAACGVGPIR